MTRRDLDHDGAGRPEYNAATEDYITAQAERLGLSFDRAAAIYELARLGLTVALDELPAPDHHLEPEE